MNLIEDIDRDLRRAGLGEIDEPDSFRTGVFTIAIPSKRALGRATTIISKAIASHGFSESTQLERLDQSS